MFLEPPNEYTQFTKVLILSNVEMLLFKTGKMTNKKQTQRSSRPDVFCKKGFLRNFAKFIGKHLCQSLYFNKVAGLACNCIKIETLALVFSYEFCEICENTFSYRTPPVAASGYNATFPLSKCYLKNSTNI